MFFTTSPFRYMGFPVKHFITRHSYRIAAIMPQPAARSTGPFWATLRLHIFGIAACSALHRPNTIRLLRDGESSRSRASRVALG